MGYVVCNGEKYIIDNNNYKRVYNGEWIDITEEELFDIENLLHRYYEYKDSKLKEISKINPELNIIDCVAEIIDEISDFIPDDIRDGFYERLKTLTFEVQGSREWKEGNPHGGMFYNSKDNSIKIEGNFLGLMRHLSTNETFSDPESEYRLAFKCSLTHELLHMASTREDKDLGILCGLAKDDALYYRDRCESLNEGVTELFALMLCDALDTSLAWRISYYQPNVLIVKQLGALVKNKTIYDAYFYNQGDKPIEDKLKKYASYKGQEKDTLYDMACAGEHHDAFNHWIYLQRVQSHLFALYQNKLKEKLAEKNFDEISELMGGLAESIITIDYVPYAGVRTVLGNEINGNREKFKKLYDIYKDFIIDNEEIKQKIKRVIK